MAAMQMQASANESVLSYCRVQLCFCFQNDPNFPYYIYIYTLYHIIGQKLTPELSGNQPVSILTWTANATFEAAQTII